MEDIVINDATIVERIITIQSQENVGHPIVTHVSDAKCAANRPSTERRRNALTETVVKWQSVRIVGNGHLMS